MSTISFPIPQKENERRRALLPGEVATLRNSRFLYFERGYGENLGFSDREYLAAGANLIDREQVPDHSVVCSVKAPTPEEQKLYSGSNPLIFGWIHAVQGRAITDWLLQNNMSAVAWEDMHAGGRHVFWENNEIAGYAAILHASLQWGRSMKGADVAVIGTGNTARGALRALAELGAKIAVYDRVTSPSLSAEIDRYDVVVNAVLWDVFRPDHIVYRDDLARMRPGAMIVDVSCDDGLGIETSRSTTIEEPAFEVEGILHYAVDHTAALLYKEATASISRAVARYIDELAEGTWSGCLSDALIIDSGRIVDERITRFQGR